MCTLCFIKGYISEGNYMETLLQQIVKSFPNATIRAAVPTKCRFNMSDKNIFIDLIEINKNKMLNRRSRHQTTEGSVWQKLIEKVDTPYTFAALDLLYIDPKDVSLIRMVRIPCFQITISIY
jgi:hypothetical protein